MRVHSFYCALSKGKASYPLLNYYIFAVNSLSQFVLK